MMLVHETQALFRKLVHGFSYAGETVILPNVAETAGLDERLYLTAATLLDQEVSFATLGFDSLQGQRLAQEFRSRQVPTSRADFVFLKLPAADSADELSRLKVGDLVDPQKSATIIAVYDEPTADDEARRFLLQGPGIPAVLEKAFSVAVAELLAIRNELNKEYPLGIDVILINEKQRAVCIPRTTVIKEVD